MRPYPIIGLLALPWVLAATPLAAWQQVDGTGAAPPVLAAAAQEAEADKIDPVARLLQAIESGEVQLSYDPTWGYLPDVLERLGIHTSSQSLVFSRTSLQVDVIAPWSPRAIYFNDDVYVGFIPDGLVLEIASIDPDGGSVFYTLDQLDERRVSLRRDDLTCKSCHTVSGVQGVMMTSTLADRLGYPIAQLSERPTDDRTPMGERFGGWYVTGAHSVAHAGNVLAEQLAQEVDQPYDFVHSFDMSGGGNLSTLEDRFDPSFYLGRGSDIVALMVLAHQTRVHNLITAAAASTAEAIREMEIARLTGGATDEGISQLAQDRIEYATEALVRGMLFHRAEPIGRVESYGNFAEHFSSRGPRDSKGRSLRDFSLEDRLFEHPMSFLVYSDAWDALPEVVLDRAYARIDEILTSEDDPDFPLLTAATRTSIREILLETKPGFADHVARVEAEAPPG